MQFFDTQLMRATIGRHKKYSSKDIENLGEDLIEYCKKDHVFHLVQWTRKQNKCYDWWLSLQKNYPDLVVYHKRAKEILGGKIIQLAFESGNKWAIQTFIPMYVSDVWEFMKEKIKVEASARAEATKEALMKNPDHPFWDELQRYMDQSKDQTSTQN